MKKKKLKKKNRKSSQARKLEKSLVQLNIQQVEERLEMSALLVGGGSHVYSGSFDEAGVCSNDKCFNNDLSRPSVDNSDGLPDGSGE